MNSDELIQKIADVNSTIAFWESILLHDRFLMDPSSVVLVENTVKHLKHLKDKLNKERDVI